MLLEDYNREPWFIPRRARLCKDSILNRLSDTDLFFYRVDITPLDEVQYSCLENPMDRGAWQATVHGVTRVGHDLETKPPPPPLFAYLFVSLMSVSLSELGNLNVLFSLP